MFIYKAHTLSFLQLGQSHQGVLGVLPTIQGYEFTHPCTLLKHKYWSVLQAEPGTLTRSVLWDIQALLGLRKQTNKKEAWQTRVFLGSDVPSSLMKSRNRNCCWPLQSHTYCVEANRRGDGIDDSICLRKIWNLPGRDALKIHCLQIRQNVRDYVWFKMKQH